jgi:hypothetical protein
VLPPAGSVFHGERAAEGWQQDHGRRLSARSELGDSPPCVQRSKMNSALQLLAVLQASLGGISRWGGELR